MDKRAQFLMYNSQDSHKCLDPLNIFKIFTSKKTDETNQCRVSPQLKSTYKILSAGVFPVWR